jgi:Tol biopolymer transport system component
MLRWNKAIFMSLFVLGSSSLMAAAAPLSTTAKAAPTIAQKERPCVYYCIKHRGLLTLARMEPDGSQKVFLDHSRNRFGPLFPKENSEADWNPVSSRDGSKIAFFSTRSSASNVWVADADGSNPRPITHDLHDCIPKNNLLPHQLAFSPDSAKLAYIAHQQAWVFDFATGVSQSLNEDGEVRALSWTKDGKALAYVKGSAIRLARLTSPITTTVITEGLTEADIHCDPNNQDLIYFMQHGIWVANTKNRSTRRVVASTSVSNRMDLSADGSSLCLLTESQDHQTEVSLVKAEKDAKSSLLTLGGAKNCLFMADNRRILFSRNSQLWSIGTDSRQTRPLTFSSSYCPSIGATLQALESR